MADIVNLLAAAAGAGGAEETDPNFNQTVLLLHGDGTDGAQNNTFLDSSTNNFTITRNGNTTQGTFSPFSRSSGNLVNAPYDPAVHGGSGYFDGTGDFLAGPTSNSAFDMGSGDWTLETWAYPRSLSTAMAVFVASDISNERYALGMQILTSGAVTMYQWGGASYFLNSTSTTGVVTADAWYHIVAVRSGSDYATFVNGTRVATVSSLSGTQVSNYLVGIGQDPYAGGSIRYNGYFSSMRIVKGTAVYDPTQTTITEPTAPLTAVSGTSLLLNFTNAGIFDNTGKNNLETVGNAQIDTTTKKYGTGSMEFDGTGDWLLMPSSQNFAFGTGPYTVEFWLYKNSSGAGERGIFQTQTASLFGLSIFADGSTLYIDERKNAFDGSDPRISGTITQNDWIHVAVCREGGTGGSLKAFVNGTQLGSTVTSNLRNLASTGPTFIGNNSVAANAFIGYIDDLRITKGVARYTTTFTPPTAAFPDL